MSGFDSARDNSQNLEKDVINNNNNNNINNTNNAITNELNKSINKGKNTLLNKMKNNKNMNVNLNVNIMINHPTYNKGSNKDLRSNNMFESGKHRLHIPKVVNNLNEKSYLENIEKAEHVDVFNILKHGSTRTNSYILYKILNSPYYKYFNAIMAITNIVILLLLLYCIIFYSTVDKQFKSILISVYVVLIISLIISITTFILWSYNKTFNKENILKYYRFYLDILIIGYIVFGIVYYSYFLSINIDKSSSNKTADYNDNAKINSLNNTVNNETVALNNNNNYENTVHIKKAEVNIISYINIIIIYILLIVRFLAIFLDLSKKTKENKAIVQDIINFTEIDEEMSHRKEYKNNNSNSIIKKVNPIDNNNNKSNDLEYKETPQISGIEDDLKLGEGNLIIDKLKEMKTN